MELIAIVWNELLLRPMLNGLLVLYKLLFSNFGLSIIFFTIIIRLLTLPLTMRQLRATRAMSLLQPKLKETQQKYGKDRQRVSQETMKLYREHGVNPLGCLGPMLIQFPIWIGLYQSIIQALNQMPEGLLGLSRALYPWLGWAHEAVPLSAHFLWLNLAVPDPTPVLPILVGGSMWAMQKMTTMPSADSRQAATNRMMLWMWPLMFAFLTFSFPSGLALYWVASNMIGIVIQYFVTGLGGLKPARAPEVQRGRAQPRAPEVQQGKAQHARVRPRQRRSKRQDRG